MSHTIAEIAEAIGAQAFGDVNLRVCNAAEPAMAGPDDLALAMDRKYAPQLAGGRARAAMLWDGADWQALGLKSAICVARPRFAMAGLTRMLDDGPDIAAGIDRTAIIGDGAVIGEGAAIGPFVVIGRDVRIGARARIASHVSIARSSVIGDDALILQGVRIGPRVFIGDRFVCQPGAVIGADGFSFVTEDKSRPEIVRETLGKAEAAPQQNWTRIHSLGCVEIGDDVEIGANATIDRGTVRATRVGSGSKLDNLVHLGHNVTVGRDCLLCGLVGVAGSSRIGDRVVLGGQCGVSDNIFVGDDVVAGGGTKILANAPAGRVLLGYPAMKMTAQMETWKHVRRLGRLFAQVAELREAVAGPHRKGDGKGRGGDDD
ncbi:MAG: UDP-3-O-(3-hydroxymyristoyl)glucosamine N-acyltransferase [Rhodobacteraceae bacterium]|nr:UDP-3-O-(3-hydroxymyristoyl)glucosamine N-acyltransferase [Paracoccaceae bacterium]